MTDRILNFSAGPGVLPLEVLEEAQRDLVDYQGAGLSVMELSHRSPPYLADVVLCGSGPHRHPACSELIFGRAQIATSRSPGISRSGSPKQQPFPFRAVMIAADRSQNAPRRLLHRCWHL